jgi:hypothetical protein
MREVRARVAAALLLAALLLGTVLLGEVVEPALVAGVLGALLCVWAARPARAAAVLAGPAVAARARRRALARRGTPAQRDPDAAGRTRSRAPSGLLPAV